jgi:GTP-binding protein EngB required for normal cell division
MKRLITTSTHGKTISFCSKDFKDKHESIAVSSINGSQYINTDPIPVFQNLSTKYRNLTFHVKSTFKNKHGTTVMVFEATNGKINVLEQNNNHKHPVPPPIAMSYPATSRRNSDSKIPTLKSVLTNMHEVSVGSPIDSRYFWGKVVNIIETKDGLDEFAKHNFGHCNCWDIEHSVTKEKNIQYVIKVIKEHIGHVNTHLDIGAGRARLSREMEKNGVKSYAIDGIDYGLRHKIIECVPERYTVIDFCSCKMKNLNMKKFDIITAFEILEHLYPEDICTFLENCTYMGKYLFASLHHCGEDSSTFDLTNHNTVRQYEWWAPVLENYGEIIFKENAWDNMSGMDGSTLVIVKLFDKLKKSTLKKSLDETTEIQLSTDAITKIDINYLLDGIDTSVWEAGWNQFQSKPGHNHYKLLAYLSQYIDGNIIDIGTLTGASAIALSHNTDNKVYTFDLAETTFCQWGSKRKLMTVDNPEFRYAKNKRKNIVQKIGDVLESPKLLLNSKLIFLDIDHSGKAEDDIVQFLMDNDWKGILIMDDTHDLVLQDIINKTKKFATIHDLTDIGHSSGTTAMVFGTDYMLNRGWVLGED